MTAAMLATLSQTGGGEELGLDIGAPADRTVQMWEVTKLPDMRMRLYAPPLMGVPIANSIAYDMASFQTVWLNHKDIETNQPDSMN